VEPRQVLELARLLRSEVKGSGLERPPAGRAPAPDDFVDLYDVLISPGPLRSTTRKLFADGHYAEAVEEEYKCVNNSVKEKAGLSASNLDGRELVERVFSLNNPVLKLNALRTESERSEQRGYMSIFAGCWTGIRCPHAHEHDLRDDPSAALETLVWANHLMRVVERAKRARRKKGRQRQAHSVGS